jgi:hypothetical protein
MNAKEIYIDILSVLITKSSLHGGMKYSYRDMKLNGRAKKHPTGASKNTIHRKGKKESAYKRLCYKYSFMKKIYDCKRNNIDFNEMPEWGTCPKKHLIEQFGYTEREIHNSIEYFKKVYEINLVPTKHGYYTFRLFQSNKYVF